jgi:hypothetical protein
VIPLVKHASHVFLRCSQCLVKQAQSGYLLVMANLKAVPIITQVHASLLQALVGFTCFLAVAVLRHARLPKTTINSNNSRGLKGKLPVMTLEICQCLQYRLKGLSQQDVNISILVALLVILHFRNAPSYVDALS